MAPIGMLSIMGRRSAKAEKMSDDYDNTLAGSAARCIDALHAVTVAPLREFATTYLEAMNGDYGALWLVLSWALLVSAFSVLVFGMLSTIAGMVSQ